MNEGLRMGNGAWRSIRVGARFRMKDAKLVWEEHLVGIGPLNVRARMGFVSDEVGASFGM